MIFAIVWLVVLWFISQQIPCYDEIFWIVTFFVPPLILYPILVGCEPT